MDQMDYEKESCQSQKSWKTHELLIQSNELGVELKPDQKSWVESISNSFLIEKSWVEYLKFYEKKNWVGYEL